MMYGSFEDSLDCSAGYNARKVADWVGVSCSIKFIYLTPNQTVDAHMTGGLQMFPTYVESTDMYAGFQMIYLSNASRATVHVALTAVFDWQAIVMSL
jgi:hypothetical protein